MTYTVITLTPEELTAMIDKAVEKAVARHADIALTRAELADHFGVCQRTIDNWITDSKINPVTPEGKQKKYSLREIKQAKYEITRQS